MRCEISIRTLIGKKI